MSVAEYPHRPVALDRRRTAGGLGFAVVVLALWALWAASISQPHAVRPVVVTGSSLSGALPTTTTIGGGG